MSGSNVALSRTKMANHRTYLAYMRTALAVAGIAGIFRKLWIALFGVVMAIGSTIQYAIVNVRLDEGRSASTPVLDYLPVGYAALAVASVIVEYTTGGQRIEKEVLA